MNNESQLENSDFSDGYLLMEDNPKKNRNERAADLYYNEPSAPLTIEDIGSTEPTGHYKTDPMPKLTQENAPVLESIDGQKMTVMESFNESQEQTAASLELKDKYKHEKVDMYEGKKYFDDITLREHGEKIARVIAIDLIVIFIAAAVNSFFTGDGMDFIVSLIKIGAAVLLAKGYLVARWFTVFTVTLSVYGPFVLLFVSEEPKEPWQIIVYSAVLLMYVLIDVLLIFNKDIKEFCQRRFFN